jgi:hypothetical protein
LAGTGADWDPVVVGVSWLIRIDFLSRLLGKVLARLSLLLFRRVDFFVVLGSDLVAHLTAGWLRVLDHLNFRALSGWLSIGMR